MPSGVYIRTKKNTGQFTRERLVGNKFGFQKGHTPWNNRTKGKMKLNSGSFKKGEMSENQKGENNSNWKGGISINRPDKRTSLEYKLWRKSVYERDNFTCQKYGGGKEN